jgi:hypothetical protein
LLRILLVEQARQELDRAAHEAMARRVLARFRIDYARAAGNLAYDALVAELAARCPGFAALWNEPQVATSAAGVVHHPELGGLALEHSDYVPAGHPTLRVVVLVPKDGPTAAKIATLHDELRAGLGGRALAPHGASTISTSTETIMV